MRTRPSQRATQRRRLETRTRETSSLVVTVLRQTIDADGSPHFSTARAGVGFQMLTDQGCRHLDDRDGPPASTADGAPASAPRA